MAAVIGRLWTEGGAQRRDHAAAIAQKDHELAEAHALIVQLQEAAAARGVDLQREHLRDLRRLAGLSASVDPPPRPDWPPPIVRAEPARGVPQARKPRK